MQYGSKHIHSQLVIKSTTDIFTLWYAFIVNSNSLAQDFHPSGFEESLMKKDYYKDGRVKFSSETETSQSEYDSEADRSPRSQPSPPMISQPLKDFRLMEGSDATFVCKITGNPRPKV